MFKDKENGVVCSVCLNGMFILIDGVEFVLECIGMKDLYVLLILFL